ncbi:UPF0481 protein At3g47200-like [Mangifera indica]|uniref:UPF0481 protein At3g47200-like n=1 Tax=Mangifera indica TaxID=29780 RepID=UPI001CFC45F6|nr:UPF0481 protein At3g47200-like [Mangifera indica]
MHGTGFARAVVFYILERGGGLFNNPNSPSTNKKAMNPVHNRIPIPREVLENKRQQMSSMDGASSRHSTKGKDKEAVEPEELAEIPITILPDRNSLTRFRIEDMLRNIEKKRNSVQFFSFMRPSFTINSFFSRYMKPEIVSIGPFNSKESNHLLQFEECKWFFLHKFLRRCEKDHRDLEKLLVEMQSLEDLTRDFYSDYKQISEMPVEDLILMMLLDGAFLVELLCYLRRDDDPIVVQPCLIPVLARDVLKLENQLTLFVLTSLFGQSDKKFMKLALEFFNLYWTGLTMSLPSELPNCSHLLELFYWSSVKPLSVNHSDDQKYASTHSMQCVTELKRSGIKFKQSKEAESFLDIKFKNRILEIPAITFNEMLNSVLINCVAFEQSREFRIKYFSNYVSFFSCLISQPSDVSSLFLDGIISKFSEDDQSIADFFNNLGRNIGCVRYSYLSVEIKNVEACYKSDRASLLRNYFTTKWTVLKVLAASLLLVFTFIQTLISILSYIRDLK